MKSHISVLALSVSLLSGCTPQFTETMRVREIHCSAAWDGSRSCAGEMRKGADLKLTLNPLTGTVLLEVLGQPLDFWGTVRLLKGCSIVNVDNWECGGDERIGMVQGQYFRTPIDQHNRPFSYEVGGVSGWQYWALRSGSKAFKLHELIN
jgi:hypothetical protein